MMKTTCLMFLVAAIPAAAVSAAGEKAHLVKAALAQREVEVLLQRQLHAARTEKAVVRIGEYEVDELGGLKHHTRLPKHRAAGSEPA